MKSLNHEEILLVKSVNFHMAMWRAMQFGSMVTIATLYGTVFTEFRLYCVQWKNHS